MTGIAEIRCPDADATRALGVALARHLCPGALLLLEGPIGAGKTCLAQGIAHGLGVVGPVPSPTFILVAEYPDADPPLFHADLYRLERAEEIHALDIPDRLGLGAWLIEWADRFPDLWPDDHLRLSLRPDPADPGARLLTLAASGPSHRAIVEAFLVEAFLVEAFLVEAFLNAQGGAASPGDPV